MTLSLLHQPTAALPNVEGEVSLLLGAGFSVGKGYPTARQLNERITGLQESDFTVSSGGTLGLLEPGQEDPFQHSSYFIQKLFTLALIQFYAQRHAPFNYEAFFDYYVSLSKPDTTDAEFEAFWQAFRKQYKPSDEVHNLLDGHNRLFNQIIAWKLKDGEGQRFYPPVHHGKPIYPSYTGFLNCLEAWGKQHLVHVHTLNHDLFFESLSSSDWLKGELSDGFRELGSPYYGRLQDQYMVRLSYFANEYPTRYRLYKLHGSLDQYPYYRQQTGLDGYVKIKPGVGSEDLFRESQEQDGQLQYERCWINYHSDFLSGTTSKILRYDDPFYREIFTHFKQNLQKSKLLIIVGYGGADLKINELIEEHFSPDGRIYLVEPYPHADTQAFLTRFNAHLVEKLPGDLTLQDFM